MTYATIIIDDLLLTEKYGFLNFRKLLALMDQHDFHTTVAFIPWNYNRTNKKIAQLFLDRPDRLSLCVHGCDHTRGEFGSTDMNYLDNKIKVATARMLEHQRITGLPFDRVMVFPQGVFTNEVLEALKNNGYIAAVNTEPAMNKVTSDFPFFLRYPLDEVCGHKPAFVVMHHQDFQGDGYDRLVECVRKLKGATWASLGEAVKHYVTSEEPNYIYLPSIKTKGMIKTAVRRYLSEARDNYSIARAAYRVFKGISP